MYGGINYNPMFRFMEKGLKFKVAFEFFVFLLLYYYFSLRLNINYVCIFSLRVEDFQENGKILANEKVSLSVLEDLIEYLLQRTSGKLSYKMDSVCLEFRRTLLETFRTTDSNLDSENGWTEQKEANQTEYNESDWVGLSQVELSKEQAMNCLHTIVKVTFIIFYAECLIALNEYTVYVNQHFLALFLFFIFYFLFFIFLFLFF